MKELIEQLRYLQPTRREWLTQTAGYLIVLGSIGLVKLGAPEWIAWTAIPIGLFIAFRGGWAQSLRMWRGE